MCMYTVWIRVCLCLRCLHLELTFIFHTFCAYKMWIDNDATTNKVHATKCGFTGEKKKLKAKKPATEKFLEFRMFIQNSYSVNIPAFFFIHVSKRYERRHKQTNKQKKTNWRRQNPFFSTWHFSLMQRYHICKLIISYRWMVSWNILFHRVVGNEYFVCI